MARLERIDGSAALRHHAFVKDLDGIYAVLAILLLR